MQRFYSYIDVVRLPRKKKKDWIGRTMSKAKLRRLIDSVVIIQNKYPISETIEPFEFCPNCGCQAAYSTNNMAMYPERWVIAYCARCDERVSESDNSPYWHVLCEIKENEGSDTNK